MKKCWRFKIHPAGIVLFLATFLFADSHLAFAAAAALLLHEGAHLHMLRICGMDGCTVELTPFGGLIDSRRFETYPPWKQAAVSGAGIAFSGILACFCKRYLPYSLFAEAFVQANLSLFFLNALPLWPLDGARVIAALAAYTGMERWIKKWLSLQSVLAGVGFVLLGLYGAWKGVINPGLLIAGPYLCYAACAESVSARVRKINVIERKWNESDFLPVSLWAGNAEKLSSRFAAQLGRGKPGRYQVVLAVDPSTGSIQKCWTEQEMLHQLLESGRN